MMNGITEDNLKGAVEALLFVHDAPVSALSLADVLDCKVSLVQRALDELARDYVQRNAGLELREVAGGWKLYTAPVYHDAVAKCVLSWDAHRLTQAALETLAIVAYNQPVTRLQISSIRGVNSDSSLSSLIEKGLVHDVGVADTPGNPVLYATTQTFLEKFGLNSIADLPELGQFAPDEETRTLIMSRLGVHTTPFEDSENPSPADLLSKVSLDDDNEREAVSAALSSFASAVFGTVEKVDLEALHLNMDEE